MTLPYRHRQTGWVLLIALAAGFIAITVLLTSSVGADFPAFPVLVPLAIAALIAVLILLLSSMTVAVTESDIVWYFGPHFWKNRLSLSEITAAAPIRTKWYWGYGIKFFGPNRWLYNVSGLQTVELTLKNGGWLRIGTDDAEGLLRALRERAGSKRIGP